MNKNNLIVIPNDLLAFANELVGNNMLNTNIVHLQRTSKDKLTQIKSLSDVVKKLSNANSQTNATNGRFLSLQSGDNLFCGSITSEFAKCRKSILESGLVETIIALPSNFFSNEADFMCLFVLNTNKPSEYKDKIQLIDATCCYCECMPTQGTKTKIMDAQQIKELVKMLNAFQSQTIKTSTYILKSKVCNLSEFKICELELNKVGATASICEDEESTERLLVKTELPLAKYYKSVLAGDYKDYALNEENTIISYEILFYEAFARLYA